MSELSDEQIEALCEATTKGPWWFDGREVGAGSAGQLVAIPARREDAEFIAAARTLVPSLLERAQKAEAERDEARRLLLDETYRPEGGEIVMRELARVNAERDALAAKLRAVEALHEEWGRHGLDEPYFELWKRLGITLFADTTPEATR